MTKKRFNKTLENYLIFLKENNNFKKKNLINYSTSLERSGNWKSKDELKSIIDWYELAKKKNKAKIKKINLDKMNKWNFDYKNGSYYHESKSFFKIEGYRTLNASREVKEWDQPFITQVGYVGGIIGLIRKKFNGLPHYLTEAKFEPGNYNKIQISPSVQATYSNLNRIHEGKKNIILKYILQSKTLVKKLQSEDGGRFMNKRNLHWIVETDREIKINKKFKWLTLWEIKKLSRLKSIVSPHLRSIISLI